MSETLSYKKILKFWLPLLATWLMMSIEGPYLAALIARMPEPEFNLAAYGVAFAIALIVESPVIMMLSTSTALVEDKSTFLKLRKFVYTINFMLILLMTILILPPIFDLIALKILNLPEQVAHLTHMAIAILIPWAPAIGYRRFYQGILIRNNLTRLVAFGTIIRLISMSITAFVLYSYSSIHGVLVGAAALSIGVIAEAVATRIVSHKTLKRIKASNKSGKELPYPEIIKFYFPLVLTSFISLGVHPIVIFFMGQSLMPLESLAVLPVINGLVFIFRSFGLSYQEVGIALMKTQEEYIKLKNFAIGMAVSVVVGLGLVSFTPLGDLWLLKVAGLSQHLAQFAALPLMLYTIFPALTVWINFQRSVLVNTRNTNPISFATIAEVVGIVLVLLATINFLSFVGVVAAVLAYTIGRLAANFYLIVPFNKAKKSIAKRSA